ncbi:MULTISPECIES: hypothetical protein [Actinosynnema]|uniref:hypothetical protein n=1 Tax=Actinosynnema TaxID=40566 RepID=UPI0020A5D719|nr:hypothetical protein [Actinosynnema pretiosum]MCP2097389.1 hypothetical protein [Actinosynnema pretiosum]
MRVHRCASTTPPQPAAPEQVQARSWVQRIGASVDHALGRADGLAIALLAALAVPAGLVSQIGGALGTCLAQQV